MKKYYIIYWVLFLGLLVSFSQPAFGMKKVAQSKLQFLNLEMGARAIALGGAYTALSGDPNCIYFNPAGTAFVEGIALTFNHAQWLADISYESAVLCYNAGQYGNFSVNYLTVNYGTFERTIVDAQAWEGYIGLGEFEVGEYALGLGYSHQITDRFFIGGQMKYAYQRLGTSTIWEYVGSDFEAEKEVDNLTDVVAYDFGTFYNSGFKNLCVGMSVQNFANKPLPLNFRFGIAVDLNQIFFAQSRENRLTLACDVIHPRDYAERIQTGLEYQFKDLVALRGGYKFNYDEQGITGGVGFKLNVQKIKMDLDYAFNDFGLLGTVHRFTIGLNFH